MTEKDYNPEQKNMKMIKQQKAVGRAKVAAPKVKEDAGARKPEELIKDKEKTESEDGKIESIDEKKTGKLKNSAEKEKIFKIKKEEARVYGKNLPISMKKSRDFCRFIKYKKIEKAIKDIEDVINHKRAVPAKGEVPHKRGRGMASGIYSDKTAKYFLALLKSLQSNANNFNFEDPIIVEAVANIGERSHGKFGRVIKKRSHINIIAKEISKVNRGSSAKRR